MKNEWLSLIGFLIFTIGFIALILNLVGLRLSILSPFELTPLIGLILKLTLLFGGMILFYLARTNSLEEE